MNARERWQRWAMAFGCPTGQAEALELEYADVVHLEAVITYALMNTTDQLRKNTIDGEPLTMMGLRNYVEGGDGGDSLVLWFRVPWWPTPEA